MEAAAPDVIENEVLIVRVPETFAEEGPAAVNVLENDADAPWPPATRSNWSSFNSIRTSMLLSPFLVKWICEDNFKAKFLHVAILARKPYPSVRREGNRKCGAYQKYFSPTRFFSGNTRSSCISVRMRRLSA
jgi:hypothetical protein